MSPPAIEAATLAPLHRAAFEADLSALRKLLAETADPDAPGLVRDESDGWRSVPGPSYLATPLMLAASGNRRDSSRAVRMLLDAGARPNARSTRNDSALCFAAEIRNHRAMRVLLENGADPNSSGANHPPLCTSARLAGLNGVRMLLRFGASPNPVARNADDDPVEPAYSYRIPLFSAAEGGSVACARLILEAGARLHALDVSGRTVLMYASTAAMVRFLVGEGCSPNARETCGFDRSVLDIAACDQSTEVLVELVAAGADINARNPRGQTPLIDYCGTLEVRAEMVQALIDAGADVHATRFKGCTALHEAVQLHGGDRRGKLGDIVRVLVEAGLDVNIRDDRGHTPLHYAVGEEGLDLSAVKALIELGVTWTPGDGTLEGAQHMVEIWKTIAGHSLRNREQMIELAPSLAEVPEEWFAREIEQERSGRRQALDEAEEALRLLSIPPRRAV